MALSRVQWGKGRKNAFEAWIHEELNRAMSARSTAEADWRRYESQYRAPQSDQPAHFPFEGAHNFTLPITAMDMDPILAMYMGNLYQSDNLWTTQALSEKWLRSAKPLQDYLTFLDRMALKMWDVGMRANREMVLLGTTVYKTYWMWEARNTRGYDAQGNARTRTVQISRPVCDHVNLADFLLPPEARSEDPEAQGGAQWVAERHRKRAGQLIAMSKGQTPFLPNFDPETVERAVKMTKESSTDKRQNDQRLDHVTDELSHDLASRPVEFWEIHARFDTTGNGIEDDIIVHYHKDTNGIFRAVHNYHPGGRPYDVARYLRGAGFYGIGIGEQTDSFQGLLSNILNYDLDKLLLSNAPMWQAPEGASILPNEPIFPGKIWFRPPGEEIKPLQMLSNGNFDMLQMIDFVRQMGMERAGIGDIQKSNIRQLPSRTPATTVNSMLQQSATRFDMSIKDLRQGALSNVGMKVLQNLQEQTSNFQHNPLARQYSQLAREIFGMPEGQEIAFALENPGEPIEFGIGVKLTATSGQNNKEMARQSKLQLLSIGSQFGGQLLQLAQVAQQMAGTPVGQVATDLFDGGAQLLRQTLAEFDVVNPEDFVPDLQLPQQGLGPGAFAGGPQLGPEQGGPAAPGAAGGF